MRQRYWDVLKGLGIIAVVIGHTLSPLVPFIYMYHIALFFFVAGFFYKDLYSDDPTIYISKKIGSLYWPFVKYGLVFLLLHNILLDIGVYGTGQALSSFATHRYSVRDSLGAAQGIINFSSTEQMVGAMWFLVPLFVTSVLFCLIRYVSRTIHLEYSLITTGICVLGLYMAGFLLVQRKVQLLWHADIALVYLPVFFMGYLLSLYRGRLQTNGVVAVCAGALLIYVYRKYGHIEPSARLYINPWLFLLCSMAGIYFNMYLGRLIEKSSAIGKIAAYIGRSSMVIMTLHFISFKLVSYLYIALSGAPRSWLAKFPIITAENGWWICYSLVGVSLPLLLSLLFKQMRKGLVSRVKAIAIYI